jgi:hypothetical protein
MRIRPTTKSDAWAIMVQRAEDTDIVAAVPPAELPLAGVPDLAAITAGPLK